MIFLFRWQKDTEEDHESKCPDDIWFANQLPENACATVALLNIINNIPDVLLGEKLDEFKKSTQSLTPFERGRAIDEFLHVKVVHNSFARETDVSNELSSKKRQPKVFKETNKRKNNGNSAQLPSKKARTSHDTEYQNGTKTIQDSDLISDGLRRSSRTRKQASRYQGTDSANETVDGGSVDMTEEGAYHFIAYMPIKDQVWRLDGMNPFPQNLGLPTQEEDWLPVVKSALQARMAKYEKDHIDFNLMAVVQDPVVTIKKDLAVNHESLELIEAELDKKSPDWRQFLQADVREPTAQHPHGVNGTSPRKEQAIHEKQPGSPHSDDTVEQHEANIEHQPQGMAETEDAVPTEQPNIDIETTKEDYPKVVVPASIIEQAKDADAHSLLSLRTRLLLQQASHKATIRDELQSAESDREQARLRREEFKPFFSRWVASLEENNASVEAGVETKA